jgi:hypothetical protein
MSIDNIPIWLLFLGTIIFVMISMEIGHRLGHARRRRSEDEKETPVGAIAGAILGLSAFMLAFSFGITSNRYDTRKELVRDEAVAIRTAWNRADFLPDKDRTEAKSLLRDYVNHRLAFSQTYSADADETQKFLADAQRIQDRLWEMAVANARLDMNSDVAALYIDSLNQMNATHARRVALVMTRIPLQIRIALLLITALGMMAVGYQTGIAGSKRSMAGPILAVSFAIVAVLIASLDRPETGVITVTQQPLIDLQAMMANYTPS